MEKVSILSLQSLAVGGTLLPTSEYQMAASSSVALPHCPLGKVSSVALPHRPLEKVFSCHTPGPPGLGNLSMGRSDQVDRRG